MVLARLTRVPARALPARELPARELPASVLTWPGTLAMVLVGGLISTGCTMCPDPFDYSGPVPNGSSPQNDFRARSGGILRLGAAARPWPQIVNNGEQPAAEEPTPTLADECGSPEFMQTAAVEDEDVAPVDVAAESALLTEPALLLAEPTLLMSEPAVLGQALIAAEEPRAPAMPNGVEAGMAMAGPVPPAKSVSPVALPLGSRLPVDETPGWRARRR